MFDLDAYMERISLDGRSSIAQVHRGRLSSIPFEHLDPHQDLAVSWEAEDIQRQLVTIPGVANPTAKHKIAPAAIGVNRPLRTLATPNPMVAIGGTKTMAHGIQASIPPTAQKPPPSKHAYDASRVLKKLATATSNTATHEIAIRDRRLKAVAVERRGGCLAGSPNITT